jgi:hypothetical protein
MRREVYDRVARGWEELGFTGTPPGLAAFED